MKSQTILKAKFDKIIRVSCYIFIYMFFFNVYADGQCVDNKNQYSIIELNIQKEQWLKTSVPLVTISADATLNKKESLIQSRENILNKLNSLGEDFTWDITVFNSSQSDSGLEEVHLQAQARITEKSLNTLRQKVETLTQPGLKIQIIGIDFSPSLAETEKVLADLRSAIYKESLNEVEKLKTVYGQTFKVSNIVFNTVSIPLTNQATINTLAMNTDRIKVKNEVDSVAPIVFAVSSKMQLSAKVQLMAEIKN